MWKFCQVRWLGGFNVTPRGESPQNWQKPSKLPPFNGRWEYLYSLPILALNCRLVDTHSHTDLSTAWRGLTQSCRRRSRYRCRDLSTPKDVQWCRLADLTLTKWDRLGLPQLDTDYSFTKLLMKFVALSHITQGITEWGRYCKSALSARKLQKTLPFTSTFLPISRLTILVDDTNFKKQYHDYNLYAWRRRASVPLPPVYAKWALDATGE